MIRKVWDRNEWLEKGVETNGIETKRGEANTNLTEKRTWPKRIDKGMGRAKTELTVKGVGVKAKLIKKMGGQKWKGTSPKTELVEKGPGTKLSSY